MAPLMQLVVLLSTVAAAASAAAYVNGEWSDWTGWSGCSHTCGGGVQTRERSCSEPAPQGGGQACDGSVKEQKPCNENDCPVSALPAAETCITFDYRDSWQPEYLFKATNYVYLANQGVRAMTSTKCLCNKYGYFAEGSNVKIPRFNGMDFFKLSVSLWFRKSTLNPVVLLSSTKDQCQDRYDLYLVLFATVSRYDLYLVLFAMSPGTIYTSCCLLVQVRSIPRVVCSVSRYDLYLVLFALSRYDLYLVLFALLQVDLYLVLFAMSPGTIYTSCCLLCLQVRSIPRVVCSVSRYDLYLVLFALSPGKIAPLIGDIVLGSTNCPNHFPHNFKGYIDSVSFAKHELSAAQVKALYRSQGSCIGEQLDACKNPPA
ncbi:hypothetical protein NP493_2275g00008 [Ridgeia piscesae]|uniref:Uncharacterized protein n=1 Tax=Ridgeia piscesae TaxID=27915 RepID=A0AAD9JI86_RIDPI|nr:hypothetical protein NP493_2275g00008 [Ridgeia piscesae]